MGSLALIWQRIDTWLSVHAPPVFEQLEPGASQEELDLTEATLGFSLPEDFKESYRVHNGGVPIGPLSDSGMFFLSLDLLRDTWLAYKDAFGRLSAEQLVLPSDYAIAQQANPIARPLHWHPKLVPFATSEDTEFAESAWCLDLDPGSGGRVGQIISWHRYDGPCGGIIASSFEALFSQLADDLEADQYLVFPTEYDVVLLERRLPAGKLARDQARRHAFLQPSPGKELLQKARQLRKMEDCLSEQIALSTQILQMEQTPVEDHFWAYSDLISLYRRVGNRPQAERVLEAFAKEAESMPAEHWVYDDLEEVRRGTFQARYALSLARQTLATREAVSDDPEALQLALSYLAFTLHDRHDTWTTTQERFAIYSLFIETSLRLGFLQWAREALSQLRAEVEPVLPDDPIHEVVHHLTALLHQQLGNEEQPES